MMMVLRFLLYIWQLPQNLLGLGLLLLCRLRHVPVRKDSGYYILEKFWAGGVSLGNYIFILSSDDSENTRRHESGHQVQSRWLGPFYLLVVGLPSACLCLLAKRSRAISRTYFRHFPESWADKISHIDRHS